MTQAQNQYFNQETRKTLLDQYRAYLYEEEKSANTIAKYMRDLQSFFIYLQDEPLTKENLLLWKSDLTKRYAPASVNSMLAAANSFVAWAGFPQYRVKPLKIQHSVFTKPERDLDRSEYIRLVQAAGQKQNNRLALLLQTICATGIRVSELCYITTDALCTGRITVTCKGKIRTIFLPSDLCRALRRYCRQHSIESGVIFRTRSGRPLDRSNIWHDMKALCKSADVEPEKVYPHNLRHLFAKSFYQLDKDLTRLADLLGHSNINTTRIYTMESGASHAKRLEHLGLVVTRT